MVASREHGMKSILVRLGGILLVGALIPACTGGRRVSPILFSDGFNSGFPSTLWTAPVITGSATAASDGSDGFPPPSLKMTTSAATASVKTDTISSFNNPSLTITVDMAALSGA